MAAPCSTKSRRFHVLDRVVCNIGHWAPGAIDRVDVPDPDDETESTIFPYVVQLDAPHDRLVSVPSDSNACIRPEVCFGAKAGGRWFTLYCLPLQQPAKLRFCVGDRVACAVEDAKEEFTIWEAGTIDAANFTVDEWEGEGGSVPYRIKLDSGPVVLAHRDVHWLVRDLALQHAGPRDNARERFAKRRRDDYSWEDLDHETRNIRPCFVDLSLMCGECEE